MVKIPVRLSASRQPKAGIEKPGAGALRALTNGIQGSGWGMQNGFCVDLVEDFCKFGIEFLEKSRQ